MSGVIGGAGSRSGIIGQTELDYEEGSWTPTPGTGSFGSYGFNYYRKIGGWCVVGTSISNITGGMGVITGLPFATNPAGSSYEGTSGSVMMNQVNTPSGTSNVTCYIYNNAIYIYATVDDSSWQQMTSSHVANNDDMILSAYYFAEN